MLSQKKRSLTPTKTGNHSKKPKNSPKMNFQVVYDQQNIDINPIQQKTKEVGLPRTQVSALTNRNDTSHCDCLSLNPRTGSSPDLEQALRMALQMVERIRIENQELKQKQKNVQVRNKQIMEQNNSILQRNQELESVIGNSQQKYRKLKHKYKDLKEQIREQRKSYTQLEPTKSLDNSNIKLKLELELKQRTIKHLCLQIDEYQTNSQNVLRILSVLQQKVEQLTMGNNLLQGMIRQNQASESDANSTIGQEHRVPIQARRYIGQYEKYWNVKD